jgi:uncharacterized protein (DUF433 family)
LAKDYVEERSGGYYVAGTRVSLDSVVYGSLRGESPEAIAESLPALTLEQVLGALAFYLGNRANVDQYLRDSKKEFERLREQVQQKNPVLYSWLRDARQRESEPGAWRRDSKLMPISIKELSLGFAEGSARSTFKTHARVAY